MTTGATVEFYFDPVSPYAWLAAERLDLIVNEGVRVVCRPVLLAALLDSHGTKGPAEVPAKRDYVYRDVMRQAVQAGLPFRGPPAHPFNPLLALRAATGIQDDNRRLAFARALLSAVWSEGSDATDPGVIQELLLRAGETSVDPGSPDNKLRLRARTQAAIDAGIFGVPTFRLGEQLFWGADRLDALLWALRGGDIDEAAYAEVLSRPVGAVRSR